MQTDLNISYCMMDKIVYPANTKKFSDMKEYL